MNNITYNLQEVEAIKHDYEKGLAVSAYKVKIYKGQMLVYGWSLIVLAIVFALYAAIGNSRSKKERYLDQMNELGWECVCTERKGTK